MYDVIKALRDLTTQIIYANSAYEMRRRYNPHHPEDQVEEERKAFVAEQTAKFYQLKNLYLEYRVDILKYMETIPQEEKQELDFTETQQALERIIQDDMEAQFGL